MGTKTIPGLFDCHAAAEPNEPLFTLLSRDPLAPGLVDLWADLSTGNIIGAVSTFARLIDGPVVKYMLEPRKPEKVDEARNCAEDMREWFDANPHA